MTSGINAFFQKRNLMFFESCLCNVRTERSPSPALLRARRLWPSDLARYLCILLRIRDRRSSQWLVDNFLLDLLIIAPLSEFVDPCGVNFVSIALIQVDEEDDVVAQSSQAMKSEHLDGKCEEVVDECVEDLVCHGSRGHVGNALWNDQ